MVSALASFNDGLKLGNVKWNKMLHPQVAFRWSIVSQLKRGNEHSVEFNTGRTVDLVLLLLIVFQRVIC